MMMSTWNGTIIGPGQSVHENRIYSLQIYCGPSYPDEAPTIRFVTRVNLPCVGTEGEVNPKRLAVLANWDQSYSLETVLSQLRRYDG